MLATTNCKKKRGDLIVMKKGEFNPIGISDQLDWQK